MDIEPCVHTSKHTNAWILACRAHIKIQPGMHECMQPCMHTSWQQSSYIFSFSCCRVNCTDAEQFSPEVQGGCWNTAKLSPADNGTKSVPCQRVFHSFVGKGAVLPWSIGGPGCRLALHLRGALPVCSHWGWTSPGQTWGWGRISEGHISILISTLFTSGEHRPREPH